MLVCTMEPKSVTESVAEFDSKQKRIFAPVLLQITVQYNNFCNFVTYKAESLVATCLHSLSSAVKTEVTNSSKCLI
jgi:hypothetical protein